MFLQAEPTVSRHRRNESFDHNQGQWTSSDSKGKDLHLLPQLSSICSEDTVNRIDVFITGEYDGGICVLCVLSDEYLKPVMTLHPQSVVALKDGMLNLTCQAFTSSRSMLTVLWKKDHMVGFTANTHTNTKTRQS